MDRREKAQTSEIRALFSFRSILIYFTKLWYLFLILLLIDLSLHEIQSQNHSKRLIVDGVRVNRLRNKREISNEITSPTSTSASILTTKADSIASSLNNHYTICMNYFHRFNSKHTACLGPNPQCIISQRGISKRDRKLILDAHNYYRNLIASGKESKLGFPSAANMLTLQWDESLAYVAQKHADQCRFEHDCYSCRRTGKHSVVGQNLYQYRTSKSSMKPQWKKIVKEWYEEIEIAPPQVAVSFQLFELNIGHFTQIAWATTNRIGCGFTSYQNNDHSGNNAVFRTVQLYTCNYAPGGNFLGEKMYEHGQAASQCPSRYSRSKRFKSLCESVVENLGDISTNPSTVATQTQTSQAIPISSTVLIPSSTPTTTIILNPENYNQSIGTDQTIVTDTNTNQSPASITNIITTTIDNSDQKRTNYDQGGQITRTILRKKIITHHNGQSESIDHLWQAKINNWKNIDNSGNRQRPTSRPKIARTDPPLSFSTWKWRTSNYDWKRWLTNYTQNLDFTDLNRSWQKPLQSSVQNRQSTFDNNLDPSWHISNFSWYTNWTYPKPNPKRLTTRIPTYTWALSVGYQRSANNFPFSLASQQQSKYNNWSRSIDLTPNNLNTNLLQKNRFVYY
ncbi:CRISP/Allergen/PR-1 [Sarcoptes scabiei]|nr:CRISP/Allergen/PR-1 [Sarcoptes scabiei]